MGARAGVVELRRARQKVAHAPRPPSAVQMLRTSAGPEPATWSATARIAWVSRATHAASVYRVLCASGEGGGGGGSGGESGGGGGGGRSSRSVRELTIVMALTMPNSRSEFPLEKANDPATAVTGHTRTSATGRTESQGRYTG